MGTHRTRGAAVRAAAAFAAVATLLTVPGPVRAYADPTPAELDAQVATAWDELESVVEHYDTTRENLAATRARVAATDAQLAPLNQQIDDLQRKVGTIAAGIYKSSGEGPATALLSGESAGSLLNQLALLDHVARDQDQAIQALRVVTDRYETQRRALKNLERQQSTQDRELTVTKAVIESNLAELQALRTKVYAARASRSGLRDPYVPVFPNDAGGTALRYAYQQLGKWYEWAAAGPNTFDCSGLVLAAFRQAGRTLPHSAALQWKQVRHITRDDLRPGDLVFYYSDIHHVAMYAGDGRIIEAPQTGQQISIHQMDHAPIVGYGRVV
ncbi:glycoside hydrolase [Planosporangium thailandense]|uniref:Glycoside hydrolase n=1 Tax=Planosporangium thailandense TaxID=765197 RepID=A0ABX0XVK1_9ACTN|nr:glycoside hydrolase [Planosporangium thailandense]